MLGPLHQPRSPLPLLTPLQEMMPPYVLIHGKQFEVLEAYSKSAEGRLVNDQQFIQELEK